MRIYAKFAFLSASVAQIWIYPYCVKNDDAFLFAIISKCYNEYIQRHRPCSLGIQHEPKL